MGPESLETRIERLIKEILEERRSVLPENQWSINQEVLMRMVIRRFGDGDISKIVLEVIGRMEHGKFTLMRTHGGELELVARKKTH